MSQGDEGLPKLGEVIAGKYRIGEELGRGGMGVVLAATRIEDGTEVALKLLLQGGGKRAERFAREARIGTRLQGTHVVRVFDYGVYADESPFLVMERLYGDDLKAAARRGGMAVEEACGYLMQACAGLAEAHAAGIIHRDLKPANLFLSSGAQGNHLKVLDFGIGKVFDEFGLGDDLTATTALMGSPLYMPPERLRSGKEADPRGDIWALGSILFELLTGQAIFEGDTLPILCVNILNQPPRDVTAFRADVPASIREIIARCMAKKKEERYGSVLELAAALRPFAGTQGPALLADVEAAMAGAPPLSSQRSGDVAGAFAGTVRMEDVSAEEARSVEQARAALRGDGSEAAAVGAGRTSPADKQATHDGVVAEPGVDRKPGRGPVRIGALAMAVVAALAGVWWLGSGSDPEETAGTKAQLTASAAPGPKPQRSAALSGNDAKTAAAASAQQPATKVALHREGLCAPEHADAAWVWMTLETEKQAKHVCFRCDVKLDAAEASETPCTRVEPASGWQTAARCKQNVCSDKAALTKALQRSSPLWPTLEPIVRSLYNDARARRSDAKKSKKSGVKTSRKRKVKPVRRPPRPQPTTKAGSNSDDQFNSNF